MAITSNPIPQPIQTSSLSIGLQEIARIPDSGTGAQRFPRLNYLSSAGDSTGRLFVNDSRGILYVIDDDIITPYLDVRTVLPAFQELSVQQGFTYFAFHPEFEVNGIFYTVTSELKSSGTPDFPVTKPIIDRNGNIIQSSHHDVIREWRASNPYANSFSGTMREVLRIEQPYRDHNTSEIAFNPNSKPNSPDYGMLYIGTGDGGSDGFPVGNTDPLNMGQDLNSPLGKILRIFPTGNNSTNGRYGIPSDNPFVADVSPNTLSEIWAYGFRNPHRFSWDYGNGKMLIADIGQAFIEEINLGVKGGNYGWGNREGTFVIEENNENILYPLPPNDSTFGYTYPVAQYDHDIEGNVAVAGGYVYRGSQIPELVGQYIFGDFANDGRFFHVASSQLSNGRQDTLKELRLFNELSTTEQSFLQIVNDARTDVRFGQDEDRNLFVTTKRDGKIRMIVRSPEFSTVPQIFVNNVTVIEGINNNVTANFIITLNRPSANNVTVDYNTVSVTAMQQTDYIETSGSLTFTPRQIRKKITVPIINNNLSEALETFRLTLTNPSNANIGAGTGTATIVDTVQSSLDIQLQPLVENLTLISQNNVTGSGNNANNRITGNTGNNILNGLSGNDILTGGVGNDILTGGVGNNILTGGVGNDVFVFEQVADRLDRIVDFNPSNDYIQLSASGFSLPLGTLSSDSFLMGTQATNSTHRIIYNSANGALFFDSDGVGGVSQVQIASLVSSPSITHDNIQVV